MNNPALAAVLALAMSEGGLRKSRRPTEIWFSPDPPNPPKTEEERAAKRARKKALKKRRGW